MLPVNRAVTALAAAGAVTAALSVSACGQDSAAQNAAQNAGLKDVSVTDVYANELRANDNGSSYLSLKTIHGLCGVYGARYVSHTFGSGHQSGWVDVTCDRPLTPPS